MIPLQPKASPLHNSIDRAYVPVFLLAIPLLELRYFSMHSVLVCIWVSFGSSLSCSFLCLALLCLNEPLIFCLLQQFFITAQCHRKCISFLFGFVLSIQDCIIYVYSLCVLCCNRFFSMVTTRAWYVITSILDCFMVKGMVNYLIPTNSIMTNPFRSIESPLCCLFWSNCYGMQWIASFTWFLAHFHCAILVCFRTCHNNFFPWLSAKSLYWGPYGGIESILGISYLLIFS